MIAETFTQCVDNAGNVKRFPLISVPEPLVAELHATAQAELERLAAIRQQLEQQHAQVTARMQQLTKSLKELAQCSKQEVNAISSISD